MPSSRFYSAPVDPGYDRFGAAIAQGLGAGVQNYITGQDKQEEDARRNAAIALEAQRHDEDVAARQQAELNQYLLMGGHDVTGAPSAPGPVQASMMPPPTVMGHEPPPAPAGGTAATSVQTIDPSPVASVMGVPGSHAPVPPPATVAGAMGPPPAAPVEGSPLRVQVGNHTLEIDPSKSLQAQQAAIEYKTKKTAEADTRSQIQSVIAKVLQNGKVDLDEIPELTAYGIDPAKLDDPQAAEEKAFKAWQKKYDIEQKGRVQIENIQAQSQRNALTANQAEATAARNAAGMAGFMRDQGKSAADIYAALAPNAVAVGGEGALRGIISQAMMEKEGITPNQARQFAAETLAGRNIYPGEPGYDKALSEETNKTLDTYKAREAARRKTWENTPAPVAAAPSAAPAAIAPTAPINSAFNLGNMPGASPAIPAWQARYNELEAQGKTPEQIKAQLKKEKLLK